MTVKEVLEFVMNRYPDILDSIPTIILREKFALLLSDFYEMGREEGYESGYSDGYDDCVRDYDVEE